MSDESPLHVVLGAGQVGVQIAEKLIARGARVRLVRRRAAPLAQATDVMSGDLRDRSFAEDAIRGAAVVYQCAEPSYDRWLVEFPSLIRGVLHGTIKAGARLIVLDNVYMYGAVGPHPIAEETPIRPNSRKGELRAQLADDLLSADRRGDVRVAIGRASDFIGPRTTIANVFHEDFYRGTLAGQAAQLIGDPEQLHSFSYTPDVAEALVTLGARDEALGKVWHLPALELSSTRSLVERLQRALGAPVQHEVLPDDVLKALGEQNPIVAEVVEMTYLWKTPLILDDTRFRTTFGLRSTPLDEAITSTARWARETFAEQVQAPHEMRA